MVKKNLKLLQVTIPIILIQLVIANFHARGVLKFGFGRDVSPRNLKVDPYKYQFFKKK